MPGTWLSYGAARKRPDGTAEALFADRLRSGDGDETTTAIQKMRLLQAHGWPEARLRLKDRKGKSLIDRIKDGKEPKLYVLKCKPSCWRLYFYVHDGASEIIYLHPECKKKQARDPEGAKLARGLIARIQSRDLGISRLEFPGDTGGRSGVG